MIHAGMLPPQRRRRQWGSTHLADRDERAGAHQIVGM
jgi:hypothetical protein